MAKVHLHKRIFYVPGLISLVVLPMIFWHFYSIQHKKSNLRTMSVAWVNDNYLKRIWNWFPATTWDSIQGFHPSRNFELLTLTGNESYDQVKLNYFQIRMREILSSNDSINGVKIHFTPLTSYNSVVKSINLCKVEGAKIYWPYKDNLYFWHEPPVTEKITRNTFPLCGGSIIKYIDERTYWEKLYDNIKPIITAFWHILTGFLLLCTLGLVYIRKHFWKKH